MKQSSESEGCSSCASFEERRCAERNCAGKSDLFTLLDFGGSESGAVAAGLGCVWKRVLNSSESWLPSTTRSEAWESGPSTSENSARKVFQTEWYVFSRRGKRRSKMCRRSAMKRSTLHTNLLE